MCEKSEEDLVGLLKKVAASKKKWGLQLDKKAKVKKLKPEKG